MIRKRTEDGSSISTSPAGATLTASAAFLFFSFFSLLSLPISRAFRVTVGIPWEHRIRGERDVTDVTQTLPDLKRIQPHPVGPLKHRVIPPVQCNRNIARLSHKVPPANRQVQCVFFTQHNMYRANFRWQCIRKVRLDLRPSYERSVV